ncbi:alpha/beta hydrolase family esterase [Gemmatimonadota bacterium]
MMKPARTGPLLCLVAAYSLLSGCSPATDPVSYEDFIKAEGEGEFGIWVHSGFYNRTYFLHTPPDLNQAQSYPLLIFLHGAGGKGESFHALLKADEATDAAGFITVYPDGMEGTWTVGCDDCTTAQALEADDVTFLATLARHLAEYLPVDTTRVHVMGFSQGGSLAHLYGCESTLAPAGIAAVASLLYRNVRARCAPASGFPVAIVHGTHDALAYYSGYGLEAPFLSVPQGVDAWVEKMGCGTTPTEEELPDRAADWTTITAFRYDGCTPGASVLHLRVNGGGHTWPGDTGPWGNFVGPVSRDIDATQEILDFFASVREGG